MILTRFDPFVFFTVSQLFNDKLLYRFRWNYALSGLNPWSYHVVNVLLHATVCYLFAWLCRNCFHLSRLSSLLAASLFALHPIHTEAVSRLDPFHLLLVYSVSSYPNLKHEWFSNGNGWNDKLGIASADLTRLFHVMAYMYGTSRRRPSLVGRTAVDILLIFLLEMGFTKKSISSPMTREKKGRNQLNSRNRTSLHNKIMKTGKSGRIDVIASTT